MSEPLPPTEGENPRSAELDLLSTLALVELLVDDQRAAVDAVLAQSAPLARAVDEIAARLARGGRLHYVGAGSSGRIAMLDASEMPPTFGTPREMICAHIAGGAPALVAAVEGAEDDAAGGETALQACVRPRDAVIGISAAGAAAFVVAALERGRAIGAYTIALTANADSPLARSAELAIVLPTGAEVLAGSTRLKAGTAQKIALNAISTAVMVRLGKVLGNLMVDLVANNRKLRARARRLVVRLAEVDESRADELLELGDWSVKVAVVMERHGVGATQARALLQRHDGSLRSLM